MQKWPGEASRDVSNNANVDASNPQKMRSICCTLHFAQTISFKLGAYSLPKVYYGGPWILSTTRTNLANFADRWYNISYTLFAVSILLAVVFRQMARTQKGLEQLFAHIDRAITILQAMDECIVARNAVTIVKRALDRARKLPQQAIVSQQTSSASIINANGESHQSVLMNSQANSDNIATLSQYQATDDGGQAEAFDELDWLSTLPFDDSQQSLFWTQWAHEIDILGK